MSEVFDLKMRLSEMGLQPKKSFGQNFLVSRPIIEKIIGEVALHPFKDLIEVGPGLGALTESLVTRGYQPKLIEFDRELAEYWRGRGLPVFEADAVKLDWNGLDLGAPALLVSNLPYQISTHLMVQRCFEPRAIQWMVLMFQKEVAQRLTASPRTKEYGTLSVMAQLHFSMGKVSEAGPGDFYPPPKVASRVLFFERLPDPRLGPAFLKFVKHAFLYRRKFLLKKLKGVVDKSKLARLPEIAASVGVDAQARAEDLSPSQFAELFRVLHEH